MTTIIIQRVKNGWIVRPFNPCQFPTVREEDQCFVFTTIEELTAALPELLRIANNEN